MYLPPHTCKVWDYNSDLINRSIEIFDGSIMVSGKCVHEQVILSNKTTPNICHNFVPNKIIICDDNDPRDEWRNKNIN